jgi:hypothetical protein
LLPPHRNPPTSPLTPGLLTKRGFVEALSEWQSPYPSTLAIICWVLSTSCTHPCDEKKAQGKFYHHEICSCHVMIMNATDVGRHKNRRTCTYPTQCRYIVLGVHVFAGANGRHMYVYMYMHTSRTVYWTWGLSYLQARTVSKLCNAS